MWILLYPFIYLKLIAMKIRAMFWCEYAYINQHPFFSNKFIAIKTYGGREHAREYWIRYINPRWNDDFQLEFNFCRPEIMNHPVFDEKKIPKIKRKSK